MLTDLRAGDEAEHAVKSEAFTVTPGDAAARCTSGSRAKGVEMTPQVFDGAGRLMDEQLGYEIARYVFGRPAEFRRRAADQRDMQTALQSNT